MSEQMAERAPAWGACFTCRDYARERREAISVPLANKARREGRDVIAVVDEFMSAAHDRHMTTGEPLREGGPTRVTDPLAGRLLATYALLGSMGAPTAPAADTTRAAEAAESEESHE